MSAKAILETPGNGVWRPPCRAALTFILSYPESLPEPALSQSEVAPAPEAPQASLSEPSDGTTTEGAGIAPQSWVLVLALVVACVVLFAGCAPRSPSPAPTPRLAATQDVLPALLADLDALELRAKAIEGQRMLARDAGPACRSACVLGPAKLTFRGSAVDCVCRKVVLP